MQAYDESNKANYDALSRSIKDALEEIENRLDDFCFKPTDKDLAKLAGCSVSGLRKRAMQDVKRFLPSTPENGLINAGKTDIFKAYGWPLDELRRLQFVWKSHKKGLNNEGLFKKSERPNIVTRTQSDIIKDFEQRISRYMQENKRLLFDLDQKIVANQNMERSLKLTEARIERLQKENDSLRSELALWKSRKVQPLIK